MLLCYTFHRGTYLHSLPSGQGIFGIRISWQTVGAIRCGGLLPHSRGGRVGHQGQSRSESSSALPSGHAAHNRRVCQALVSPTLWTCTVACFLGHFHFHRKATCAKSVLEMHCVSDMYCGRGTHWCAAYFFARFQLLDHLCLVHSRL